MKMVTLACAGCGASFERRAAEALRSDRVGQAAFCSQPCRRSGQARACERCGKTFYVNTFAAKTRPSRWCSRECADVGRKRGEMRSCETCGKAFYLYPSGAKDPLRAGRFCSAACYKPHRSELTRGRPKPPGMGAKVSAAKKGKPQPWRVKPPIAVTCLQCGQTIEYAGRARYFAQRRRFCTRDCAYAYIRLHPEQNPLFKGGREPYYGPNWRHQQKLARERDNHTCQECGVRQFNPRLDVHHIQPRRGFEGGYEAMNALSNLITLCKSCHRRKHTTRVR